LGKISKTGLVADAELNDNNESQVSPIVVIQGSVSFFVDAVDDFVA